MASEPLEIPGHLDAHEAAQMLGASKRSVNRMIKEKRLPAIEFLGKNFIEREELKRFKATYRRYGRRPAPEEETRA